jgi:hypothetical protein
MTSAELAFAVMSGITVSGLLGSVMEVAIGKPVSFGDRIGSRTQFLTFALSMVVAGPMMLANDAIRARREGRISQLYLGFCGLTALVWAGALGIVAVGLIVRILATGFQGCWC